VKKQNAFFRWDYISAPSLLTTDFKTGTETIRLPLFYLSRYKYIWIGNILVIIIFGFLIRYGVSLISCFD
jgi:hypothetical protein